MKHSVLPFKVYCLGSEGFAIRPVNKMPLTELKAKYRLHSPEFRRRVYPIARFEGSFEQQKANAELFEKACNNFYQMKEALEATLYDNGIDTTLSWDIQQRIINLLSQLEEVTNNA